MYVSTTEDLYQIEKISFVEKVWLYNVPMIGNRPKIKKGSHWKRSETGPSGEHL
jgi:hypothetical protein